MKQRIKVTLEYWAHFQTAESQDYRITKITNAPTVQILNGVGYDVGRIGDLINEEQAEELSKRVEVTTVSKH